MMDLLSAVLRWSEPKGEGKVSAASLSNKLMVGPELEDLDEFVSIFAVSVMGSIDQHWICLDLFECFIGSCIWWHCFMECILSSDSIVDSSGRKAVAPSLAAGTLASTRL
jgi:hypothetical protein